MCYFLACPLNQKCNLHSSTWKKKKEEYFTVYDAEAELLRAV